MKWNRANCESCGKEFSPPIFGRASRLCPECRKEEEGPRIRTMADVVAAADSGVSVTTAILGLNVAVFIGMTLAGVSLSEPTNYQLLAWGANFGPYTLGAQPWRAFTYMFVHGGIMHLAFNMWALWQLGKLAEGVFGRVSFAVLYLLCGLGAAVASLWWHPVTVCVGASGAIFGVAGALLSYLRLKHLALPRQYLRGILSSLGAFVVFNLVIGGFIPFIDNAAHVGGLLTGLLLGALLPRPAYRGEQTTPLRYFAFPLVAAAILFGGWVLEQRALGPREMAAGVERAQAGDFDGAIPHLEKAVRAMPDNAHVHLLLGDAYVEKKRYADAAAVLARASALDPQNVYAHLYLGFSYYHLGRLAEAGAELQKAVDLDPTDAEAHFYLGLLDFDQGKYDAAVAQFQKTLQLDPQYEEAQKALADAQAALDKQSKASSSKAAAPPGKITPAK